MSDFTFGLDFGTSKTAVTLAQTRVSAPITDVALDGARKRIPTCVVIENDKVWIGRPAEQHILMEQDSGAHTGLSLQANFKPHIHQDRSARDMAGKFINALAQTSGLTRQLTQYAHEAIVAAGCPVSWSAEGAATLLQILRDAGFPPAFAVPEPVGAAFYFLGTYLKAQHFHRDIVVFDWGAGTFDMTVLRAGTFDMTVLRAGRLEFAQDNTWGSTLYGGRLFDDLFYQWVLEVAERRGHGKDVSKLVKRKPERAYLHALQCREIKESFSGFYSANEPERKWVYPYPIEIGVGKSKIDLGNFAVPRLAELDDRMRAYRASDMARSWLEQARTETRPEEREFVDALLDGRAADLRAWGEMLVTEGLTRLRVTENATAVLTGGSCNWKWFQDIIRKHRLFAGRETAIYFDDEPEMTIARGLARAYTIGIVSKRMIGQVSDVREKLLGPLYGIHRGLLEDMSLRIDAQMRADDKLQRDVLGLFKDFVTRSALAVPSATAPQHGLAGLLEWLKRFFHRVINEDPDEQSIRADLERLIREWLNVNAAQLQDRWGGQFAQRAHRSTMELLRQHLQIEHMADVAIEACNPSGEASFATALGELGRDIRLSGLVARFVTELQSAIGALRSNSTEAVSSEELEKRAQQRARQLFEEMPSAIRRNIERAQPPEKWAQGVVADLIRTLQTLVHVSRVDTAPGASL